MFAHRLFMVSAPVQQNRLLGIGLRLGGALSFGCMAACIKLASEGGTNLAELAFYRFLFSLPPIFFWIALTGNYGAWRTERPLAHLTRSSIGLATMVCAFSSVVYLPLAEATTLSFAVPLFSVILSALLLKEQVGPHRWSAVAAGFLGVFVVMQPGDSHLDPVGLGFAIAAAFGGAAVVVTIRQIGRTESAPTTVLWFTLSSTVVTGLLMPAFGQAHDATIWAILIAMGLFGGIGQLFMTSALRFAPVSVVVPFDYSQLILAVTLGWIIWDTHPPATTWAGAAVIIASGLYTLYREHKLGREKPAPEPA